MTKSLSGKPSGTHLSAPERHFSAFGRASRIDSKIGFYARGPISLPHPPYPKATLRVVERAIAEAWRTIRDHPEGDFRIETADEDRVTLELRTCLLNYVSDSGIVPGFTSELFHVSRESKFESFDGTHLDKMPDLHIYITRDNPVSPKHVDGLFVECKPIDLNHPAGADYCDKGIIRFVNGQYAWGMSEALMVGYASQGYVMPKKLQDAIDRRKEELKPMGITRACRESPALGYTQHVYITRHRRGFIYPSTNTKAPPITLRHLWLNRQ